MKIKKLLICLTVAALLIVSEIMPQAHAASYSFITNGSRTSGKVALTFDSAYEYTNTKKLLDVLKTYNVKATFFLTGQWAEAHPDLVKAIYAGGHEIGNHSYSHPHMTKLSSAQIKNEVTKTRTILEKIVGKSPKLYFRLPYGEYNQAVLKAVASAGYSNIIQWDTDSLDWKGISATEISSRVISNAKSGSIILMHVGGANTVQALPKIIAQLRSKGYVLTTVSELLRPSIVYTVVRGDTLYAIARRYSTTVTAIVKANNIANPNIIYTGQKLLIPQPAPQIIIYTVVRGDTLYAIARRYNTTVTAIVKANNIANPNIIYTGQKLIIPR